VYYTDHGTKQPASESQFTVDNLEKAVAAGKPVVAIEYVTGATKIADVQAQAAHDKLGSYIADLQLNGIDHDGILPGQTVHPVGGGTTTPPIVTPPPTTGSGTGSGTSTGGTGGTSGSGGTSGGNTGGTPTSGSPDPSSGGGHHDWHHQASAQDHGHHWHW
jgi:cysteinyl-tRNA synthetase